MGYQKIVHVVRMLFFIRQNAFEHDARGWVAIAEKPNQLAIMFNCDPLGDQVLPDHLDEVFADCILGSRSRENSFRIEVGVAAELIDALGHSAHVLPLLIGMLVEFFAHAVARNAGRSHGVLGIPQNADDLRRKYALQDFDGLFYVSLVGGRYRSLVQILPRPGPQLLDVGQKWLIVAGHSAIVRNPERDRFRQCYVVYRMFRSTVRLAMTGAFLAVFAVFAQQAPKPAAVTYPASLVETGSNLFVQHCAFCHGRDAGGGEDGPDLTRSKLVTDDVGGDKIKPVVRNGRPQTGMPAFSSLTDSDVAALVAFIHTQKTLADSQNGKRRGVAPEDLQSGNAAAGKTYFNGSGGCSGCHSPTGDLKGIATRLEGLRLEERMLYPRGAKSKATITTKSGETVTGEIAYRDEFTISIRDASGKYHGFRTRDVTYKVDAPAEAHAELLGKYTDADIHNLMAYLQSLK